MTDGGGVVALSGIGRLMGHRNDSQYYAALIELLQEGCLALGFNF